MYATGRQGDAAAVGFSPRTAATTVHLPGRLDEHTELLRALGPHGRGRACLHVKDLTQVDLGVLEELVRRSHATITTRAWPPTAG